MRIVFAGSPAFSARILDAVIQSHHQVEKVFTQPDRPAGRGQVKQASAVKKLAHKAGLPVFQPRSLRNGSALLGEVPDAIVVAAYGLMIPPSWCEAPPHGAINVHPSLLPRWRGAAPIEYAILAGDTETGVSIMKLNAALDAGPVFVRKSCPIAAEDTGESLSMRLADQGAEALLEVLDALEKGEATPIPQRQEGACYAPKIKVSDARIDWRADARDLALRVRALYARQPAFSMLDGVRVRIWAASAHGGEGGDPPGTIVQPGEGIRVGIKAGIVVQCGRGRLRLCRLQLALGQGKILRAADAVNGYPRLFAPGRCFAANQA